MAYVYKLLPAMATGLITTLEVFSLTLILSIPLGVILALGRLSPIKLLSRTVELYIWVMRGTPLLLQLVFVFFGLPLVGIVFDRFTAVMIAFVLNYGAYFGEIFRGGIESVDKGQYDGAEVLGFTPFQTFTQIVLPQVLKRTLPPVANEVITLIKDTSLVYVVGIGELLRAGKIASNRDASLVPLVVVAVFYLLLTALLTKLFKRLEEGYAYYE
ncbi:polar amino acid transport system permease protein [Anaerosolibacter carboniphilus]|uniref:Polar amino acid transport system permease protein n=2 Tax=Anaerosolibacter carboniphilus TaxID=1417629 RepID=A0A841L1W7_9FIRM|nr:amino acid ABC transporter permease [Anaerosolibacter carboniphilus]MBB6218618.1 polar amino acid transport system permease protein [Anaerosolibacter carboniphilus]